MCQAKSEPFRIPKTAQMHLQFLFLKYYFYQASLWFLSEAEKGEGDSMPHIITSPINMSVLRYSDSKAPWQAPAVTIITDAMLSVLR